MCYSREEFKIYYPMRKLIFNISLVVFSLMLLASCGLSRNVSTNTKANNSNGIEIKVTPERNQGVPQTLNLTIRNNTQEIIQFGANYTIERRIDNAWREVDLGNFALIAIMYMLQPGDSGEYTISLFPETVKYPEGEYRVVKQISIGERDMIPYYANFIIMDPR